MAQPHAKPQTEEIKKHGDPLEPMKEADRTSQRKPADPIPFPENGGHSRSAAAHLGDAKHDPKAKNDYKHPGSHPTGLKEPPQEISRVGKQHRD